MDIDYGTIHEDEWAEHFTLLSQAFNGPVKEERPHPYLSADKVVVARSGGALVGAAAVADFGQVFEANVLPMGGVTGVAVAPHATGRGVARQLMTDLLHRMIEMGHVVSLLSPSTSRLYRSVGYETANTWMWRALPLDALRSDVPDGITVEVAGTEVFDDLRPLPEAHARRSHGWLIRDEGLWSRKKWMAENSETHLRIWVAKRDGVPVAVGSVRNKADSNVAFAEYDFQFHDVFGEPDGLTAIAATLRTQSTMAGYLHTTLGPADLPALIDRPEVAEVRMQDPMMGRIVDLSAAVPMRGGGRFDGAIHLRVHDPLLPRNDGAFVIEWSGGELGVTAGGDGTIDVGVGDLSSMFSGYQAPISLAAHGRLGPSAGDADVQRLGRWLACPTPVVTDAF